MVSYKTVERESNGIVFVFVTRGKSAPFSDEEIDNFLSTTKDRTKVEEKKPAVKFNIPKEREKLFLSDLRCGLEFCTKKYGVSSEELIEETKRVFPSLNLEKFWENANGAKGQA